MDKELAVVKSYLRLAEMALEARTARMEKSKVGMSRHYARVQHTAAMLTFVREMQKLVEDDPDLWEDEEEKVPF